MLKAQINGLSFPGKLHKEYIFKWFIGHGEGGCKSLMSRKPVF